MELNYDVWQEPGLVYQAASVYTLTVATGNRTGTTASGNQSTYALADNTGAVFATAFKDASTQPGNSFQDATALVLDTAATPAAVGKPIRILLRARGAGRSHFDNIRLDGPADARATLTTSAATAITPTTAQLNGTVTAIGAGAPTITFYYGPSDGGTSACRMAVEYRAAGNTHGRILGGTDEPFLERSAFFPGEGEQRSRRSMVDAGRFVHDATASAVAAGGGKPGGRIGAVDLGDAWRLREFDRRTGPDRDGLLRHRRRWNGGGKLAGVGRARGDQYECQQTRRGPG